MTMPSAATTSKRRNGAVDLYRIIFAVMVILFHIWDGISEQGFLSVEYFFLVNGWFLAAHFRKEENKGKTSISGYFFSRLRRIYPFYFLRWMTAILYFLVVIRGFDALAVLRESLGDVLLLQSSGVTRSQIIFDGTEWFISALFLSSILIYMFLCYAPKVFRSAGPFVSVIILGSIMMTKGTMDMTSQPGFAGIMTMGFWRAFAETTLGCALYEWTEPYRLKKKTDRQRMAASVLELLLLVCIVPSILFKTREASEIPTLLMIFLFTTSVLSSDSFLTEKLSGCISYYLGELSLPVYLMHVFLWGNLEVLVPEDMRMIMKAVAIVLTFPVAAFDLWLVRKATILYKKLKSKMQLKKEGGCA